MDEKPKPLSGKKLLVAEDEAVVAMNYAAMLTSSGAETVTTVTTAAKAMRLLRSGQFDAVVLDFMLADRNSSRLQAALKKMRIPFVVVSGYPPVLVRDSASQQVLHKPVEAGHLCAAVAEACASQGPQPTGPARSDGAGEVR